MSTGLLLKPRIYFHKGYKGYARKLTELLG